MEELLYINNLEYKDPIDISAVANATMNTFNFAPNNYDNINGGEIVQLEFQEGLDFVDGRDSYIRLKLKVNSAYDYFSFTQNSQSYLTMNSGASVINLIKIIELVTKDGNTLFREDLKNQTQCIREYQINEARKNYLGIMGGIDQNSSYGVGLTYPNYENPPPLGTLANFTGSFPFFPCNRDVSFIIPLSEISPFFNTTQLIHPKFLSNSILRLTLDSPNVAIRVMQLSGNRLVDVNGGSISASLSSMVAILSEKELYEEVEEKINQQIKKSGLNFAYYQNFNTVFNIPYQIYNNDSLVFPINLSAGKIKYLAVKPMYTQNLTYSQSGIGFPVASIFDWLSFSQRQPTPADPNAAEFSMRVRLGNRVFPENYEINTVPDFYNLTCYALNNQSHSSSQDIDIYKKVIKQSPNCVGGDLYAMKDVVPSFPDINQTTGGLIWAFDFERSSCVNNSGLSTNQERLLTLELNNYFTIGDDPISLVVSVQFLTVATLFEDGLIAVNK